MTIECIFSEYWLREDIDLQFEKKKKTINKTIAFGKYSDCLSSLNGCLLTDKTAIKWKLIISLEIVRKDILQIERVSDENEMSVVVESDSTTEWSLSKRFSAGQVFSMFVFYVS